MKIALGLIYIIGVIVFIVIWYLIPDDFSDPPED